MADVAADIPTDVAPGERLKSGAFSGNSSSSDETTATETAGASEAPLSPGCTQAQLRRFIKSRPYVPMHELRRRFELNGLADEVTQILIPQGCVYVGLPGRESKFIAELVRSGDIGLELSHDPPVAVVIGVYAMRPVSR